MGWVVMTERELNRVKLLAQVDDERQSVDNAAHLMCLTRRQIFRTPSLLSLRPSWTICTAL